MTDLDRLIDDVAREMTEAPAAAELRQHVVDEARASYRDEAKASHHRSASDHTKWAWLAAAAAVVTAVYLQFGSLVEPRRRTPSPPPQTSREEPRAVPDTTVRSERPAVAAAAVPSAAPGQTRPRRAERSAAATIAVVPALNGPDALAIGPLDSYARTVPALHDVAPLDVERLDIKSLPLPH
jgi:hypothetical protein